VGIYKQNIMPETSEATAVAQNPIFFFLSKENQLKENPEILGQLKTFYANNNQLALLNTLKEAHECMLEVHNTKLSTTHTANIETLITFVAHLTHFQLLKNK
jgi:transposase-like protein